MRINHDHWTLTRFQDGTVEFSLPQSMMDLSRQQEVFLYFPFSADVSCGVPTFFYEMLFIVDGVRQGGFERITAVMPYFPFGRQNKPTVQGITGARTAARLLQGAGMTSIITVDWHHDSLASYFDVPVESLDSTPLFAQDYGGRGSSAETVIISPDEGSRGRANRLAQALNAPVLVLEKYRSATGAPLIQGPSGEEGTQAVFGKTCVLVDDLIDSGRTLCAAATFLQEKGAARCVAYVTHGAFALGALERINTSFIERLIVTDTVVPPSDIGMGTSFLSWDSLLQQARQKAA